MDYDPASGSDVRWMFPSLPSHTMAGMELETSIVAGPFVQNVALGTGAVLPSGTVTFLLTDVEGSTLLWEQRPQDMGDAIRRHYELLDEAIAAHHGLRPVEQGEGDSVVGAFAHAADAVAAAVTAQRRLSEELGWLPVRMAIHTGEAQLRDEGNYVGRTIIRCARLRGCAHGGQVLVSAATAALVSGGLDGIELVDLGAVRLRDLERPEHVWQVVADGLRRSFPPLRSLDAAPNNLPVAVTSFVGREHELEAVAALLADERLVTLTGSGGCGKTRLALHVAAEMSPAHPGGTWWVELAPVTDGADVAEALIRAVGAMSAPGADREVAVRAVRELGRALVVLDNAEHVLDDTAALVAALVAGCPDAVVMVTSREPVGVDGEVVWRVPSLPVPPTDPPVTVDRLGRYESARLFLDRARRARPNLVLDDEAAGHVAAICQRLDGIPLALELAAARVRTLPLGRLASGLDDAFRLLTGGSRTAMARQQTLLASIAWSVDLLDETELAVLRRLAVFHSSFPLEAAEAVASDGDLVDEYDVLDILGRLVDKSLVQFDDTTGRYRLLETIRQFALDRLRDARELLATRERHAEWFTSWCESLARGEHDFDIDDRHPALPDVFAALAWAYEAAPNIVCRISCAVGFGRDQLGRYHDFPRQIAWFADHLDEPDPGSWASGVTGLAWMTTAGIGGPDVLPLLQRAEPLLEDDLSGSWWVKSLPAMLRAFQGDCSELTDLVDEVARAGDDHAFRRSAVFLMVTHSCAGRLAAAEQLAAASEAMYARRGVPCDARTAPGTYGTRVFGAFRRGDIAAARRMAAIGSAPGGTSGELTAFTSPVAGVAHATGDHSLVRQLLEWQRAVETSLDAVAGPDLPGIRSPIAFVRGIDALMNDRIADAIDQFRRAHRTSPLSPALTSWVTVLLAYVLLADGHRGEVDELLAELAADVARLDDVPQPEADLHLMTSWVAAADGDLDRAIDHAHQSLRVALAHDLRLSALDALHAVAVLTYRRGNLPAAARLLAAVRAEQARIGARLRYDTDPATTAALEAAGQNEVPEAWEQGKDLGFGDAVEYASRARGERTRPTSGWASLTPTERRVAELVAAGLTNDDVARQLLMGVATVKTHLTRVFNKLDVTNRTELAASFGRHARG